MRSDRYNTRVSPDLRADQCQRHQHQRRRLPQILCRISRMRAPARKMLVRLLKRMAARLATRKILNFRCRTSLSSVRRLLGIGNHSLGPAVWYCVLSYQIGGYSASIKGKSGNTINRNSMFFNKKSTMIISHEENRFGCLVEVYHLHNIRLSNSQT
jgi:hypothetical protein